MSHVTPTLDGSEERKQQNSAGTTSVNISWTRYTPGKGRIPEHSMKPACSVNLELHRRIYHGRISIPLIYRYLSFPFLISAKSF